MNLRSSDTLRLVTGSATTVDVNVAYRDEGGSASDVGGNTSIAITTATTTTIQAPPGAGYVRRKIESVTIRNKDATSNTVTVSLVDTGGSDGTAATVEIYKVALAAGDVLMYEESYGWSVASALSIGVVNTVVLGATVANSTTTPADVTGLTFPLVADGVYLIRAVVPYTAAATTTGSRWMLNGPAITSLSGSSHYPITATTETNNAFTAYDIPAAANTDSLTAGNLAIVEAVLKPSAAGTLAVRFASEVGASAITALAGAILTVTRLA